MKRMGTMVLAAVMAISLASVANASVATPRVERREARQEARIGQGIRSGELTRGEAMRLERGQARVDRLEWRARSDGRVSAWERARMHRALNHQSRRIHRMKHNDCTR
jgi:membrane protein implicated in regulation of membrane protease activity